MKKFILASLLIICNIGFSQITPQLRPEIKKISTLYYGSTMDSSAFTNQFILRCMTTNRFDDYLVIPLGNTRENAITSLEALIQIYKSDLNQSYDIGEGLKAYSNISFEANSQRELIIESKDCAGYAHLSIDGLIGAIFGLPLWNGNDELVEQYKDLNYGEKTHTLKYKLKKGWILDGNSYQVPHFISVILRREESSSNFQISDAVFNIISEYNDLYIQNVK